MEYILEDGLMGTDFKYNLYQPPYATKESRSNKISELQTLIENESAIAAAPAAASGKTSKAGQRKWQFGQVAPEPIKGVGPQAAYNLGTENNAASGKEEVASAYSTKTTGPQGVQKINPQALTSSLRLVLPVQQVAQQRKLLVPQQVAPHVAVTSKVPTDLWLLGPDYVIAGGQEVARKLASEEEQL